MEITFERIYGHLHNNQVDGHLYEIHIDPTYAQNIRDQLEVDKNWIQETPVWRRDETLERYHLNNSDQPLVKECLEYFRSQECKQQLVDIIFSNERFVYMWSHPNHLKFAEMISPYAKFVLDKPGYYTDFHCDSRHQVVFGMIYFVKENDPNQTTIFYEDRYKLKPKEITVGMGKGWFLVNNNDAWHEGGNKSTQDRYCLQFGLNFNF